MKAGKLFEDALKEAHLSLRSGSEIKLKVRGKGRHLHLVVDQARVSDFEASILERSRKGREGAKPYLPSVPTGERVRIMRRAAGLTLGQLAEKAELSKGSLSSVERGLRPLGLIVLRRIAQGLGVPVSSLMDD